MLLMWERRSSFPNRLRALLKGRNFPHSPCWLGLVPPSTTSEGSLPFSFIRSMWTTISYPMHFPNVPMLRLRSYKPALTTTDCYALTTTPSRTGSWPLRANVLTARAWSRGQLHKMSSKHSLPRIHWDTSTHVKTNHHQDSIANLYPAFISALPHYVSLTR